MKRGDGFYISRFQNFQKYQKFKETNVNFDHFAVTQVTNG